MKRFFSEHGLLQRIQPTAFEHLSRILIQFTGMVLLTLGLHATAAVQAQTKRVVVIKVDGLPYELVERFVHEQDPLTGKSLLPWFDNVFFKNGTRITNFYVRGMSLSAPSWSTLDTGQHLQIKGNVEFDRDILHTYDYLNFIPFYFKQATGANVDMPGTEVLDSLGLPMLIDAYDNYQRVPGSQLYGRGARISDSATGGSGNVSEEPNRTCGRIYQRL